MLAVPPLPTVPTLARLTGRITATEGLAIEAAGFPVAVGSVVRLGDDPPGWSPGGHVATDGPASTAGSLEGEVIGVRGDRAIISPFGVTDGLRTGTPVRLIRSRPVVSVGPSLLGRILDGRGRVIDGRGRPAGLRTVPQRRTPPEALSRPRIHDTISLGVRAIDAMLTTGVGQRIGLFAGSGVGKSVTLGMIARHCQADVGVIALIGERGREVNDFLERDLRAEGLARSVVVVATGDEPALARVHAAQTATAIAEAFRDDGQSVLLLMDSLTRFAQAQRELALSAGEPPAARGYPPSVTAQLARLTERSGPSATGSITAVYTVLVDGDDTQEPVADTVRGLLDGHVVFSRKLASAGHFPAIDILASLSRLMPDITAPEHQAAARRVRELLAVRREFDDLIAVGAYQRGTNPRLDAALALEDPIRAFLTQSMDDGADPAASLAQLMTLGKQADQILALGSFPPSQAGLGAAPATDRRTA